jgi:hypothetical protein
MILTAIIVFLLAAAVFWAGYATGHSRGMEEGLDIADRMNQ